ncbi:MAG: DUF3726 domain-containing protein [Pseudomonadota bacterium]
MDPTIQSPIPPKLGAGLTVSLSEIEAMGRKAARGAGYSWGLAEEAGRSARWLSSHGLPGAACLAMALEMVAEDFEAYRPRLSEGKWEADQAVCPIQLGAILSDRAEVIEGPVVIQAGPVLCPLLLLPALGWSAQDLGRGFSLKVGSAHLLALPDGPVLDQAMAGSVPGDAEVEIKPVGIDHQALCATARGECISASTWQRLAALAARTYVPSTDASRQGAGAGALDND